jgi:phosphate starvation-inducible PhoH-like protein
LAEVLGPLELTINLPAKTDRVALFGAADRNLKIIREALDVSITARGGTVRLSGDGAAVNRAAELIADLAEAVDHGQTFSGTDVVEKIHRLSGGDSPDEAWRAGDGLEVYERHRRVTPRTAGQRQYVEAMRTHDMTFCTGPAGTGKTYLAVAAAVSMLKHGQARRLVLVRPAVEAGEKLGFLPGDMQQKVNPYLRPLLDALHDMMSFEQVERFMHGDVIEVAPLAFMRGRTLNDSVIIMDEAQNTTFRQMLMFLTRLGHGGKMIITGDTSQIDLPAGETSGLIDAIRRLRRVPGVAFVTLDKTDIVRHSLVQRIVDAYGQEPEI